MTTDVPEPEAQRRRTAIWVTAGAVAVVLVVLAAVLLTRNGGSGATPGTDPSYNGSAPATGAASSSTSPAPVPSVSVPSSTATGTPTVVPTQPTKTTNAPIDGKVTPQAGVEVRVEKIESVKGEAQGPGEIAGPAIRVSIEVSNESDEEVPMDLALANVYYGADKTPASTLSGPGAAPLSGTIAPGKKATGAYVFSVPEDQRDRLTIEFSYSTEVPTVIFSGRA